MFFAMMMKMSRMGIRPPDLYDMLEEDSFRSDTQSIRPLPFHPDLSPAELKRRIAQYKSWLRHERELGPLPAARQNREALLLHQASVRANTENDPTTSLRIYTTIVGFEKHCSVTSCENLERGMSCGMDYYLTLY